MIPITDRKTRQGLGRDSVPRKERNNYETFFEAVGLHNRGNTVKDEYLNVWGKPGITSFQLTGQTVKLKTGCLWVAPENNNGGYNLLYTCNDYHDKCRLMLPED